MLSLAGYVAGAESQNSNAIYTFISLYWWVPTILSGVLLILASFWNVDKKIKELEQKELSK